MDENNSTAPVATDVAPVTDAPTPEPTQPSETPDKVEQPVPTGPPPDTDSPALPDHGVDPDNPIDPDAGDAPTDPNQSTDTSAENENQTPDVKAMSRAERAAYFQQLETNTRKDVEAKVNQAYQPQAVDELTQKYIDQGHTQFEAQMLAREEQREQETDINKARAERAELNTKLVIEATEVQNSIDWLNSNKKDAYDQQAAVAAIGLYDQLCLSRDDNTAELDANGNPIPGTGQIIGASMSPKQFYGLMDNIRSSGSETARQSAMKAAEEQMAAVAAPSSNTNSRITPFEDLPPEEMKAQLLAKGVNVT